jgi:mono/diheme cytochrome c family protein
MTRSLIVASVAWVCVAVFSARLAAQTAAQAPADESQIAKGRLVVAQVCTTCHTTLGRMLQVHKQTAAQWKDTVYFMISRGAQVMPDEIDAVAAFLAETTGPDGSGARGAADETPNTQRRGAGRGQGGDRQPSPAP